MINQQLSTKGLHRRLALVQRLCAKVREDLQCTADPERRERLDHAFGRLEDMAHRTRSALRRRGERAA